MPHEYRRSGWCRWSVKGRNLEFVKREILQTYGYEHLPLLLNLQKTGLLTRANPAASGISGGGGGLGGALSSVVGVGSGSSNANSAAADAERGNAEEGGKGGFASVRKRLRLINDDVDERAPADISYVYSGYAPLSVRLVSSRRAKGSFAGPHSIRSHLIFPF